MAGPLVFVGRHAIQDGKTGVAKDATSELVRFVEKNHPRFLHFEFFFSDDGSEMTVVQVHPDEESLALHMEIAGERIAEGKSQFLGDTKDIHIFGEVSDDFRPMIEQMAMGAPLHIHRADHGFSRLASVSA